MALAVLEIIRKGTSTYGHHQGFLYAASSSKGDVKYWKCRRKNECNARLTTLNTGRNLLIRKGGAADSHNHAPNPEEVEALRIIGAIKREVNEYADRAPAAVMRIAVNASSAVQAHLPEKDNLRKTIQRERTKQLPANPNSIQDLESVPDRFTKTLTGSTFLIYDSYEDDDYTSNCGRILVFSTRENLRRLFKSTIWHLDGTFKITPSIFFNCSL